MAAAKYYQISRREKKRCRKKMMAALRKNGYSDEELLKIVDSVAGRTQTGKETAAKEILALLEEGADKTDVFRRLASFAVDRYPYIVK